MKAKIWNKRFWVRETDPSVLESNFERILLESGFCIVGKISKTFSPHGFTCVFLLSESHLAIHTFPEEEKTYIELASCNEKYFTEFKKQIKKLGIVIKNN